MSYPRSAYKARRRSSPKDTASSALGSGGSTWQWRKIRRRILARDHYTCQGCGAPANTVDHYRVRRADGGLDTDDNLRASCWSCQRDTEKRAHGGDTRQRDMVVRRVNTFFKSRADRHVPLSVPYTHDSWEVITRDMTADPDAG